MGGGTSQLSGEEAAILADKMRETLLKEYEKLKGEGNLPPEKIQAELNERYRELLQKDINITDDAMWTMNSPTPSQSHITQRSYAPKSTKGGVDGSLAVNAAPLFIDPGSRLLQPTAASESSFLPLNYQPVKGIVTTLPIRENSRLLSTTTAAEAQSARSARRPRRKSFDKLLAAFEKNKSESSKSRRVTIQLGLGDVLDRSDFDPKKNNAMCKAPSESAMSVNGRDLDRDHTTDVPSAASSIKSGISGFASTDWHEQKTDDGISQLSETQMSVSVAAASEAEEGKLEVELQTDSWESVSAQPHCALCGKIFPTLTALERHEQYSVIHAANTKKREIGGGRFPLPRDIIVEEEGEDGPPVEILYTGSKFFWRKRRTVEVAVFEHVESKCIEIVSYCPRRHKELPRMYLDLPGVLTQVKMKIDDYMRDQVKLLMATGFYKDERDIDVDTLRKLERSKVIATFIMKKLTVEDDINDELTVSLGFLEEKDRQEMELPGPPKSIKPAKVPRKGKTEAEEKVLKMMEAAFSKVLSERRSSHGHDKDAENLSKTLNAIANASLGTADSELGTAKPASSSAKIDLSMVTNGSRAPASTPAVFSTFTSPRASSPGHSSPRTQMPPPKSPRPGGNMQ